MPAKPNRLLKKGVSTLRQAQGERKNAMKLGRGTAHAELVEALGGVVQQAAKVVAYVAIVYEGKIEAARRSARDRG
jgi:hypothetical protein